MKLPVPAATPDGLNSLWYEPNSVLELRSLADDPIELAADQFLMTNSEEWDSFIKELGLQDDGDRKVPLAISNNPLFYSPYDSQLSHSPDSAHLLPPTAADPTISDDCNVSFLDEGYSGFEFDYLDELIQLADCFDAGAIQPAQMLLAQLNQKLFSAAGKPLRRAAFYFKEALQSQLISGGSAARESHVVKTIEAYKIFSNVSPVPMFSSFTANQAMLEAVDGSVIVHAVDFDIGFGCHWASFMKELADKAESVHAKPPALRITALVPDEYAAESNLIKENLAQFARELKIGFAIEFVEVRTFELLSFKSVKFMDGEKIFVLLTPAIFRRVEVGPFAAQLRLISPHLVVNVDFEGTVGCGASSFRQTVVDGLMFYSSLLESLEAANAGGDLVGKVENFVVVPKIEATVGSAGSNGLPWKEALAAAGFRQVGLSQFSDFQANCLVERMQIGGFHVAKRHAEMLLCWHDRALVATSAWK
ncbi:unnamed protein product [Cuscuta epithymum]|uniref:Scarecrow-like protein 15 n=1 Tax=Cuscuta epithymum TaxID=186058 RepID=A0AAV0D785_9ASTE|nr:unnamed protein product [Cuscuta epithymum]